MPVKAFENFFSKKLAYFGILFLNLRGISTYYIFNQLKLLTYEQRRID